MQGNAKNTFLYFELSFQQEVLMSKSMEEKFDFQATQLDEDRLPGISAIMRIKNGEEFLRISIESHIPYVDEIIACHNDCNDQTVEILEELARIHPGKIKIIEYKPKVHPILSIEHANTPTESVNSVANYYNFSLSQAKYNYAFKLDDDHLAIEDNFESAVNEVRKSIVNKEKKLFTFSGINIAPSKEGNLEVFTPEIFVGSGDHLFFPVCSDIYFIQNPRTEIFKFPKIRLPKVYIGLLYFHLKYCKPYSGFSNLNPEILKDSLAKHNVSYATIPFSEFNNLKNIKKMINEINIIEYWLLTNKLSQRLIFKVTGRNPPLKISRLYHLEQHLSIVDFKNDVVEKLKTNISIVSSTQN